MLPDRVSNPGPLTYQSVALPIALRGPALTMSTSCSGELKIEEKKNTMIKGILEDYVADNKKKVFQIFTYSEIDSKRDTLKINSQG